jgi:GT2 family glycosyltransferase
MLSPVKVIEIEVSQPIVSLNDLEGYLAVQGLVRWQKVPLGWVRVPVWNGRCEAARLRQAILKQHRETLLQQVLVQGMRAGKLGCPMATLLRLPAPVVELGLSVTVAVCTRDRPNDLARCLEALLQLPKPPLEILVIDNAPSHAATQQFVTALQPQHAHLRYVQEPRPGLDWARNRAILEANGEILAFTDDDATVDSNWVQSLAQVFDQNPAVMAVTGLVIPAELETDAQVLFEQNGGFGKGFQPQWRHFPAGQRLHWSHLGTGNLGTGANMAFRRTVFQQIGGFDPALDVGTATQGAGDLEMFFRVLKAGYLLVYEPRAIVRHYHRREYGQLRTQLANNGSVYAAFIRSAIAYPETALGFLRLGLSWLGWGHVWPLLTSLFYPAQFPRDLRLAQLGGCLRGLTTYFQAKQQAAKITAQFGGLPLPEAQLVKPTPISPSAAIAVRTVELTQLAPLTDVVGYGQTRVFVTWNGVLLGQVDLLNHYQSISVMRLSQEIGQQLTTKLLELEGCQLDQIGDSQEGWTMARAVAALDQFLRSPQQEQTGLPLELEPATQLPPSVSVSIIVATYNRPDDLHNCLRGLVAQQSSRPLEIIVVDNHPTNHLAESKTASIVASFSTAGCPTVRLVSEARQGVAYARNAGIAASRGEIIVTVDDDVTLPPTWLEKLLAPFARADVMAVTGNVLPLELETYPQQLFEEYGNGGLGRGFTSFEVDRSWFERSWLYAVPTWELGGTANSAYRAPLFGNPAIGLMDEALGPGMPSGVGEDIYLFYKILKAGGTIRYEATAYVWHKHRRDLPALKRQLYNYSKGFVSYHLTTLLRDRDYRAWVTLLIFLPLYHLKQILGWVQGNRFYPLSLIFLEVRGNLAGAGALWQSRRKVRQQGHSPPYCPVSISADHPPDFGQREGSQFSMAPGATVHGATAHGATAHGATAHSSTDATP